MPAFELALPQSVEATLAGAIERNGSSFLATIEVEFGRTGIPRRLRQSVLVTGEFGRACTWTAGRPHQGDEHNFLN